MESAMERGRRRAAEEMAGVPPPAPWTVPVADNPNHGRAGTRLDVRCGLHLRSDGRSNDFGPYLYEDGQGRRFCACGWRDWVDPPQL